MYYVRTSGDNIIAKGFTEKNFALREGFYEITKEQYEYINSLASFEFVNKKISNIKNRPSRGESLQSKIEQLEAKIAKLSKNK